MIDDINLAEQLQFDFQLDSQICTTKEQSQQLLDLGLKIETADMKGVPYSNITVSSRCTEYDYLDVYPAWSLHRLIAMCNKINFGMSIGILGIYNNEIVVNEDVFNVFNNYHNAYDNLISIIEWTIKLGLFNNEYLIDKL